MSTANVPKICPSFLVSYTNYSPVGVVDKRVETLVHPLPEDDLRRALVERHHAPRDGHVHRDLRQQDGV